MKSPAFEPRSAGYLVTPNMPHHEATFGMIKSHMVQADLTGKVFEHILDNRLILALAARVTLSGEQILALYGEHRRKPYWKSLLNSVSGPVVPMAIMGSHAISCWRELLGTTDPMQAGQGTLRALYGSRVTMADNVAHGSDSAVNAERELGLFFPRLVIIHKG